MLWQGRSRGGAGVEADFMDATRRPVPPHRRLTTKLMHNNVYASMV
jgi:hypothetical protein